MKVPTEWATSVAETGPVVLPQSGKADLSVCAGCGPVRRSITGACFASSPGPCADKLTRESKFSCPNKVLATNIDFEITPSRKSGNLKVRVNVYPGLPVLKKPVISPEYNKPSDCDLSLRLHPYTRI